MPMSEFEHAIRAFPHQLSEKGLQIQYPEPLHHVHTCDGVIVLGMGGSGLPGELLKDVSAVLHLPVPVVVSHTYGLPVTPFKNPFVIAISFSGNTREALSGLRDALKLKKKVVACIATGGEMEALARTKKVPYILLPARGLTPRGALGYTVYSLQRLLRTQFPGLHGLKECTNYRFPASLSRAGKALADRLYGKIPVFYTDSAHAGLGYIWKININETGKQPAFANVVPEAAHNEIAGFETYSKNFVPVFLVDTSARKEIRNTFDALYAVFQHNGFHPQKLVLIGKSPEQKIWTAILLAYWTSFHLAARNKKDPQETAMIEQLKARLR